jgi:hypothetical protein
LRFIEPERVKILTPKKLHVHKWQSVWRTTLEPVPFPRILDRTLNRGGLGSANIGRISGMKGVLVEIFRYLGDLARYLGMDSRTVCWRIQKSTI